MMVPANIWTRLGRPAGPALLLGALLASIAAVPAAHSQPAPPKLAGTVVWPSGKRPAPSFALRDQAGHVITLRSLRGHVVAVTFLDSHCTKACPITGGELAATQRDLGGARSPLVVVIISVNVKEDTPASTRAFVHRAGLTGTWHWLLGTHAQLNPVWTRWGEYIDVTPQDVLHTAAVYLLDGRGDVRVADAVPFSPAQLAQSVRALTMHS